ncbi:MAG: 3-phosphoshikimate 1-carboxyvinyltransferase [Actinobacteria bacterium]|nr:3-phosphoshikimate 1-carboxyvinyltransferase [Actinomycetota bacterium]
MTDWKAPYRGKFAAGASTSAQPIRATLTIPGSKSVTNRALILAALADSPTRLIRPLSSRDTDLMVAALRSLGTGIELSEEVWEVTPAPLYGPASVDVGNAGTVMRFMLPVAALAKGLVNFDGDARSHEREVKVGKESDKDYWQISPGGLIGKELIIEPDLSNAAPFMAAPIICGGEVIIRDWPRSTTQPGDRLREIFTSMGGRIEFVEEGLRISGTGKITGVDIDLRNEGELTPSIAALAALADSPSHLRGIGHLRLHETDRLTALANEIGALIAPGGGEVIEESDSLIIKPAIANSATANSATANSAIGNSKHLFHTYEDHRLATAGAILGLAIENVTVENIETTRKTLPDFPGLWSSAVE